MLRSLAEKWLRKRYVFALALAAGTLFMLLNELTYQNSHTRLVSGIQLTDIRIQAAKTLQLVTDAETGVRGYLLTGQDTYLQPYREALAHLPDVQGEAFALIRKVDRDGAVDVTEVRRLIAEKLGELQTVVDLQGAGEADAVLAMVVSDVGRRRMLALRNAFDAVLQKAASLQQTARVSLFDAMQINRLAVHALLLLGMVGLHAFMRQLQRTDELQAQENRRLALEVERRTADLRELAGHLVTAREDERGRLARELHDELGGLFTTMRLEFARMRRLPGLPPVALERIASIDRRLGDGIAFKRRVVENLRPSALDQLGLLTSLSLLCRDAATDLEMPVHQALAAVSLTPGQELTVYRLVQESLTNIAKYAKASEVRVSLQAQGEWVQCQVVDNGVGFDPDAVAAGHHGLLGMRFRVESHGGSLQVLSAVGQGTTVSVRLPALAQTPSVPPIQAEDPGVG